MEVFLQDSPFYKKWFWLAASKGLYPTILSAIGFSYIAIPLELQITVRRFLPSNIREHLLYIYTIDIWMLIFLGATVFCAIWGGVGSHVTAFFVKDKYKRLALEVDDLRSKNASKSIECYELFSNYLFAYFGKIELGSDERISLYKLDLDEFLCLGRYSTNEKFRGKPSRLYSKEQGCISKAWEKGLIEEAKSPDPEMHWENYVDYQKDNFGYTEDQLNNLRMKSRSFYGVRLKNTQNKAVGVLLFESLNVDGLPFGKIKRTIHIHEQKNIGALIESLENHIPSIENANKEGF